MKRYLKASAATVIGSTEWYYNENEKTEARSMEKARKVENEERQENEYGK